MTLLIGSSLAKQLIPWVNDQSIDFIFFNGCISVHDIECRLRERNKNYACIYICMGNDLFPSYIHNVDGMKHVCLKPFSPSKCCEVYQNLIEILEKFGDTIRFIEPPPRYLDSITCKYHDITSTQRFRLVLNSLRTSKFCGVMTNSVLLGYMGKACNLSLLSSDKIHFSRKALYTIAQVIRKQTEKC